MPVLVAVTDHAVERFRQRIGGRSGEVDVRPEIVSRVTRAWEAGRIEREPPPEIARRDAGPRHQTAGLDAPRSRAHARGSVYVRDLVDRSLVFVCRHDPAANEVVVVTLWEQSGGPAPPRVDRRWTDALRRRQR
jgi:hypothetical protein